MQGRSVARLAAVLIVAAIVLAGVGIAEGKPTRGITRIPPQPIRPMLVEISDLLATPHAPTVDDVQLEWSEVAGATHYNVYRSLSVHGDGFNFSTPHEVIPASGSGKIVWADAGAYADNNSYAWVVRPVDGNGEHNYTTNIAWKLCYDLFIGAGLIGRDQNYISLPYRMNVTSGTNVNNAAALIGDMKDYGYPQNSAASVSRWNQDTSMWEVRNNFVGTNFPLAAGEGYMVVARSNFTYKIVGAYEPDYMYALKVGTGAFGAADNYISLPYHIHVVYNTLVNTGRVLLRHIRTYGAPINSASSANKWNQETGQWISAGGLGVTDFPLKPGENYRVVVTQPLVTWSCPVWNLGG